MIPPYPLLFFGGGQEVIAMDHWIKFQAPRKIAELPMIQRVYTQHLKLYVNCDLKMIVNPPITHVQSSIS